MFRFKFIFFCALTGFAIAPLTAQIGIGVETASNSARLELSSSSRGFLMPRLSQNQRNSILSPVTGLLIFQTDNTPGFYYYTGSAWTGPLTSTEVDGLVKSDGRSILLGNLNMGSNKIINVAEPSSATDIATKGYADGLSGGLLWRESVIDLVSSAPSAPSNGDRYILSASWGGGSKNQIATYNSGSWTFTSPSAKDAVFVSTPSNGYVYNGTQWSQFNSGTVYSFTGGLSNANNTISLATNGVLNNHFANASVTAVKLNSMSASSGQVLTFNGTNWAPSSNSTGTVSSISGGTGISVTNGSTTPVVNINQLGLTLGGTNSTTGSISGSTALTMTAGGTNSSITLTPSGSGYTILNSRIGLGYSTPSTIVHLQNSNVYSGSPSSNDAPTVQLFNSSNSSSSAHSMVEIRTAGNSSGDPYLSIDVNAVKGYSMGIQNSTDRLILNSKWNFNNSTAGSKLLQFIGSGQSRVIISDESGNVKTNWPTGWGGGLCTWDLSVSGIYYNIASSMSDSRLKNTIKELDEDLPSKYMKLNPVTYFWNKDIFPVHQLNYGFISQEVEGIFPDLVLTATDEIQTKSMNYQSLTSMHVKMIKKHQSDLDALKLENEQQEKEINALKQLILNQ